MGIRNSHLECLNEYEYDIVVMLVMTGTDMDIFGSGSKCLSEREYIHRDYACDDRHGYGYIWFWF